MVLIQICHLRCHFHPPETNWSNLQFWLVLLFVVQFLHQGQTLMPLLKIMEINVGIFFWFHNLIFVTFMIVIAITIINIIITFLTASLSASAWCFSCWSWKLRLSVLFWRCLSRNYGSVAKITSLILKWYLRLPLLCLSSLSSFKLILSSFRASGRNTYNM